MKQERINAYILRVSEKGVQYKGYMTQIDNTLKAKQDIVGGLIEVIHIADGVMGIVDEEGKLKMKPINRLWVSSEGEPRDVLVGDIICLRFDGDEFASIDEADIETVERFLIPIKGMYDCEHEGILRKVIFVRPEEEMLTYGD